ncbi:efflux RND transporter periplasmic adaptor subunit [Thiomicrorhabdus arctica]|uniref:efflux RND transporter periplasmic adaptor subunit n=1 Tax=Thiomicrorhabdus arctica TaxID=131540 RepID=UPI000361E9FD|nr:efflux RND transporter periplasmic adaptor subunit [Thiomicrorhabdus arctica]
MRLDQLLAGVILLSVLLTGCEKTPTESSSIVPIVKTMVLSTAEQQQQWQLTGTITARYLSELAFQVNGKVIQREINLGDTITKNQVLYRLEPRDFELTRHVAMTNVKSTQSDIAFAISELSRLKKLIKRHLTSQQAVDQAENQVTVLEAKLSTLRLQVQQAQNQLNYTVLKSPGLGKVLSIQTEVGEVVAAGQPVAKIALTGHREVSVQIPESRLQNVPEKAEVSVSGSTQPFTATLRELALEADPLSRTWEARYTLHSIVEDATMKTSSGIDDLSLGQTAKLTFSELSNLVKVPNSALYEQGDFVSVWIVKQGKVYRKAVKVSSLSESFAWISAVDGDFSKVKSIVTLGVHLLSEGQRVRESAE